MELISSSAAIGKTYLDFGDSTEYAKLRCTEIDGLSEVSYWEGTSLYFLTENIQPKTSSTERQISSSIRIGIPAGLK